MGLRSEVCADQNHFFMKLQAIAPAAGLYVSKRSISLTLMEKFLFDLLSYNLE